MVDHASRKSMSPEQLKSHFPIGTQIRYEYMGHEGVVVGYNESSLLYRVTTLIRTPNTSEIFGLWNKVGKEVSVAYHYRIEVIKPKVDYSAITAGVVEGS